MSHLSEPQDVISDSISAKTNQPQPRSPPGPSKAVKPFYIQPPQLEPTRKEQYISVGQSSLGKVSDMQFDEIIGEYRDKGTLYYYARYLAGIAHKVASQTLLDSHPELIEKYKQKKQSGLLRPFDPSANYVHPLSRPKLTVNLSRSTSVQSTEVFETPSQSERDTGDDFDEDDDDEGAERKQPSRSAKVDKTIELPFSPRKTRSRNIITVDSESEGSAIQSHSGPRRRSTRAKKATQIYLETDDDDYRDDDGAYRAKARGAKPAPKTKKVKTTPPMYGRVRDVSTADDDPFSDDDEKDVLRSHRAICERCHSKPAHILLEAYNKKAKKAKKRVRKEEDEFEEEDDEDTFIALGGWVQCLRCPVATHWKCIPQHKRDEILKAIRDQQKRQWESHEGLDSQKPLPPTKKNLDINLTTEFVCGACERGGVCMGCMEAPLPLPSAYTSSTTDKGIDDDIVMEGSDATNPPADKLDESPLRELLFRCFTCKRPSHYQHLRCPPSLEDSEASLTDIALYYQNKSWLCSDCASYRYSLDKIIAWRPYPPNAVQPTGPYDRNAPLPREYLVKWDKRSYRHVDWVPHMWLSSTAPSKLKNFLMGGTKVELVQGDLEDEENNMVVDGDSGLFENKVPSPVTEGPNGNAVTLLSALPDAERRIPLPWKTVDRVLDVVLWRPVKTKTMKQGAKKRVVVSESEAEDDEARERQKLKELVLEKGEQPPVNAVQTLQQWEKDSGRELTEDDINEVAWIFAKWEDLGYDEATWDSPPRPEESIYGAFQRAFRRYIMSRQVLLPVRDAKWASAFDKRTVGEYRKHLLKDAADLNLGQLPNLKLMPFQVDGFNWLCNNWWNHQHCILADEMGLGKTVQIATFLGQIISKWEAFPALVVVPNSTITNWVREFERWAPSLRVVPFYGEKNSRDVVKEFELYHSDAPRGYTTTKFHVLVTTYESLIGARDFTAVFRKQPRWEVLVVDEGQRLKSDTSLLFKKLNELNTIHRIIMTGTPLNNNIRELFNLMNFLDPTEWKDLAALEKQHEELDDELVKQLHNRLRPYFLRRIKSEVLELPPKNEVIVPISMAPLQKEVYRSILSHNVEILQNLTQPSAKGAAPRGRINNVLMELRKCLQHPYLYAEDIEPKGLAPRAAHEKLIDGSGKLRFLKTLLAKLKEKGHRVLLFSQFVIALNIIEDFLAGEGYKFLRLDGNTKGKDRQKYMDEFNKPDSDIFVFLLTTRAGGVGINLFTADTVIIYDPDFNPHQDLQAIARAYRFGQKKTCLVFKLMVKDSAEERIMQIGKKKLVLDHLIVQKMDDDDDNGGENIQSILTYGAKALFEGDQASKDITYSDNDIEKLIEKTETEAVKEGPKGEGGFSFSFAKIWAAEKDDLEEVQEEDQTDSWANTLQMINVERTKEQEKELAQSGRGTRRKAATLAQTKMHRDNQSMGESPSKTKKKETHPDSDGSAYADQGDIESDEGSDMMDVDPEPDYVGKGKARAAEPGDVAKSAVRDCTLCGERHGSGQCLMVNEPENLAEYRLMLIAHADDEPWEERNAAVQAIDEILYRRGRLDLIRGQPLRPVKKRISKPVRTPPNAPVASGSGMQSSAPHPCAVCNQGNHALKDCPIIAAGSRSIHQRILILEANPDHSTARVLEVLRAVLRRKKEEEKISAQS